MPRLARRIKLAGAFIVGACLGFRLTMRLYSGPSLSIGLGIAALGGLITTVLWDRRIVVSFVLWLFG